MASFASELRACLSELLPGPVAEPSATDDPVRFFGQWLAERNLGLVPIADAASFDWPGHWIAVVRCDGEDDGEHAVVMFGSPSPRSWSPRAPRRPLSRMAEAEALAGGGLADDRYAAGRGTFSGPGRGYELTLAEAQVLDEIELGWDEARRNVVTRGISPNDLVGRRFRIGRVECVGRRLAEPFAHLERLARPGLLRPLVHRGGLRADIVQCGVIRVGDEIEAIDASAAAGPP